MDPRTWGARADFILIVVVALSPRLYRIADYSAFQGDQGVDALAVKRLLVDHILPLEGPATSAGGVHLGPFYYYLLALPMAVVWLDPLADAVFMAVLGALAAGLLYLVGREWFGRIAGVVAGGLFAFSPAAIVATRSAWNPAPAPFFALLALLGLAGFRRSGRGWWLVLAGAALGCLVQFHYFSLGLALVVLCACGWLLVAQCRSPWMWGLLGLAAAALFRMPLAIQEVADGYPNLRAAASLVGSAGANQTDSLPRRTYAVLTPSFVAPFLAGGQEVVGVAVTLVLLAGLAAAAWTERHRFGALVVAAMLLAPLALSIVYRGPIFEHYLVAYSPAVFLALGAAAAMAERVPLVLALGVLGLLVVNVTHLPFGTPDSQLARTQQVAHTIAEASSGEPFAIWLLADDDSDGAYRFQLERLGRPAAPTSDVPPRVLFVVCQSSPCGDGAVRDAIGADWATAQINWRANVDGVEVARVVASG